jgi:hypothetical protein
MIPMREATGELAEVYQAMTERKMPAVYRAPHGDVAFIIRAHSLDPTLMKLTFGFSATLANDDTLNWARRELVNAVTSRTNGCFY